MFCVTGWIAVLLCRLTASQCRRAVPLSASFPRVCWRLLASTWTNVYARHQFKVQKMWFQRVKKHGFVMRRGGGEGERAGYLGCWPAAGWNDISVCQNVKHTHMGWRSEITSNFSDRRRCAVCVLQAARIMRRSRKHFRQQFCRQHHFITMIVLPPLHTHTYTHTPLRPLPLTSLWRLYSVRGGRCVFSLAVL